MAPQTEIWVRLDLQYRGVKLSCWQPKNCLSLQNNSVEAALLYRVPIIVSFSNIPILLGVLFRNLVANNFTIDDSNKRCMSIPSIYFCCLVYWQTKDPVFIKRKKNKILLAKIKHIDTIFFYLGCYLVHIVWNELCPGVWHTSDMTVWQILLQLILILNIDW